MLNWFGAPQLRILPIIAAMALVTIGCGHEAVPMQVRFADFDKGALKGFDGSQPLVIEFQKGERIPVNLQISGEGFELDPQHPPLELVVTQHSYVRVDSKGFRISADPARFDQKPSKPGSFRFGLGASPGQRGKLDIIIEGARH